ncbi:MAG: hypothetical protein QOE05_3605 [Actinomycetota bacterium]|jgi:DNA-binding MarR family transcriptional regulator|nr:hypothetical protein [Actinomycetota bacterium]
MDEDTSPSLLFEVFGLGQQVRQLLAVALDGAPLDAQEYAFLSAVLEDEAPTPTRLAARLGMPLSTTVEQVAGFEQRGLLRRLPNPRDGRSYLVTLTAAGGRVHRVTAQAFESAYQRVVHALGPAEPAVAAALSVLRTAVADAHVASTSSRRRS